MKKNVLIAIEALAILALIYKLLALPPAVEHTTSTSTRQTHQRSKHSKTIRYVDSYGTESEPRAQKAVVTVTKYPGDGRERMIEVELSKH